MRDNVIEGLFSLFTSADRAEAIAGDLMEERETRGRIWFWMNVLRVGLTLWRNAATEAPLPILALATMGCVIFVVPAFLGLASVYLFPSSPVPVNWIALSFFWWGGALWTGTSLVAIGPRRGMAACATLVIASGAVMIALGASVSAVGVVTAVFLLLGGASARRRTFA